MTEKFDLVRELREGLEDADHFNDTWIDGVMHEVEKLQADAERFRALRDMPCVALHLSRNDHATSYQSAEERIKDGENDLADYFRGTDPAELQRMKDTNTIWTLHWYPDTPIGFCTSHGATLEAAIDAVKGSTECSV
jgi:hypothetical protein